jgi:hypothetical protein
MNKPGLAGEGRSAQQPGAGKLVRVERREGKIHFQDEL